MGWKEELLKLQSSIDEQKREFEKRFETKADAEAGRKALLEKQTWADQKQGQNFQKALDEHRAGVEPLVSERTAPLEEARKQLESRAESSKKDISSLEARAQSLEESTASLQASLLENTRKLREDLAAADEVVAAHAKQHADKAVDAAVAKAQAELQQAGQVAEERLQAERKKLQEGLGAREAEIRALREELSQDLQKAVQAQRASQEDLGSVLRREAGELEQRVRKAAKDDLDKAEASRREQDALRKREIEDICENVRHIFSTLQDHDGKHSDGKQQTLNVHSNMEHKLARVQEENSRRLTRVEGHVATLDVNCAELGSMATRQVEWRIEDALQRYTAFQERAEDADGEEVVWYSPKFEVAGVTGLQLELRLCRPEDNAETAQKETIEGSDGAAAAAAAQDCSVYLWAPNDLQASFRLFVGADSSELEHRFSGGTPCGVQNMCVLSEQLSESGALRVGVEIYDASREIPLASLRAHSVSSPRQSDRRSDGAELPGAVYAQQYFNHRLLRLIHCQREGILDLVQRNVDLVRSRSVRRVQWRLENTFQLRQNFGEGRPLCSTAFQAAGLNGLQLMFYPSGGNGAREGYCSFYLSCPPGCAVRCWLWAGRWRREARPEPADKPGLLGRLNFCRFETCVSPVDESIELAVEIEEAQQLSKDAACGRFTPLGSVIPAWRAESLAEQAAGDSYLTAGSCKPNLAPLPLKSGMLERVDVNTIKNERRAKKIEAAQQTQRLPSLWTAQPFQTFGEAAEAGQRSVSEGVGGGTGGTLNTTQSSIQAQGGGSWSASAQAYPVLSQALTQPPPAPLFSGFGPQRPTTSGSRSARTARPPGGAGAPCGASSQKYGAYFAS